MYKKRELITLPSGATAMIRPLSGMDLMRLNKMVAPDLHATKSVGAGMDPAFLYDLALTACVAWIESDGQKISVVSKPWSETGTAEIAVDEVNQADGQAIYLAVLALSGFGKEAAANAAPFPGADQGSDGSAPAGQNIPGPAD